MTPMKEFVAAAAQISIVEPNNFAVNSEKIARFHERAVNKFDAELVVFPESITTGFSPNMSQSEFYRLLPDSMQSGLAPLLEITKKTSTYAVVSSYERGTEEAIIYNSAFLCGPTGKIEGVYRKTHLFPTERASLDGWSSPGYEIPVFDTELGKLGITVCYDGDFPELSRILALKGAEIIVRPAALLRSFEIWEMSNRMRAYENDVYYVATNAIGSDAADTKFFGHSMIVSPAGRKLHLARAGEEIIAATLKPLDELEGIDSQFPVLFNHLQDRNIKSYKNHLQQL